MPATPPLILLPPSEGKTPGGVGEPWATATMQVDLDDRRRRVGAALRRAMRSDRATRSALLGVKGDALAAATAADRALWTSPTMPAIERYSGVLYGELDAPSLDRRARRRLEDSVLVVSGLWGLVAPLDPIPDYKLKMGASLPGLGRLSTWWRPAIDAALAERLAGSRPPLVWNLLPNEHAAAWSGPSVDGVVEHTVRFLEPGRDGALVTVSHWNKLLKGALVRHLVQHPRADLEQLAEWDHPAGYRLDPDRTRVDGARRALEFVKVS